MGKIYVFVDKDHDKRVDAIARLLVQHGFATIASDAKKIIKKDVYDVHPDRAYFYAVSDFNFSGAVYTVQKLYEAAARGLFVAVGTKKLPKEYEILCEVEYVSDYPWNK